MIPWFNISLGLLERLITIGLLIAIIIFQPEVRRALARRRFFLTSEVRSSQVVRQVIDAVEMLSKSKIGALLVIERSTGLAPYIESGIKIDAPISTELLVSIFIPRTPLHDGAVIIQGDRIAAAACLLPLSESKILDKRLGTRHRAAVGISEESDALVMVVSERTGVISVAENGQLTRFVTKEVLEEKIFGIKK